MPGGDLDGQLERDMQTFRQLQSKDVTVPKAIEYTLWFLAVVSVVGMLAVMPWVGHDKPIPGAMWLGYSLLFILLFSGLAFMIRIVFSQLGKTADKTVRSRMEGGR